MQRQNILRTLLFIVFFGIGTAVLSGSILCDELLRYYRNRQLLKKTEESLNRLKALNADYEILLQQLQKDPNLVKRIAPATLGTEREDEDTIYPKVTPEELDAVRRVLTEDLKQQPPKPEVPGWIVRCSEPLQRIILFLSGAFLILISFICFGRVKEVGSKSLKEVSREE